MDHSLHVPGVPHLACTSDLQDSLLLKLASLLIVINYFILGKKGETKGKLDRSPS